MRLEGLLIGGLQRLEKMFCLPAVVAVKAPVALSSDGSGFRVGIVDSFLDGLSENCHVPFQCIGVPLLQHEVEKLVTASSDCD